MALESFTAFVAAHGRRIARACLEITGNDQVAQVLRDELLVAVASRWRRWPPESAPERALVRIERLLQQEVRTRRVVVHHGALDLRSSLRLRPEPSVRDALADVLAARAWRCATRQRRARWTGLGVVALAVVALAMLLPPGSRVVDISTDEVSPVNFDAFNTLSIRGHGSPWLAQLVTVSTSPNTEGSNIIRSLLTVWRDGVAASDRAPTDSARQAGLRLIVSGPPWFSAWIGPGFATPQLVVRACDPTTLLLPQDVGTASAAVAAIDGNGAEIATLVATDGTRLEALGVLGGNTDQALVAVRTDGRSLVVAWHPYAETVAPVTHLNADAQVSIANLSALCRLCPLRMPTEPAHTNAETPVNASPTTS